MSMKEIVIAFILALIAGSVYNEMRATSSASHQTQGSGQELITELDSGNFQGIVLDSKQPVLVDFYTTWCGPCKDMVPIMGSVAYNGQDKIKVARLDCDKQKTLAERYEITSYPSFVLFQGGQVKDRSSGARDLEEMLAWLKVNQIEVPVSNAAASSIDPNLKLPKPAIDNSAPTIKSSAPEG